MPTATGPCRFGQYAPLLKRTLTGLDLGDVPLVSPTCDDGYRALGSHATELVRYGWWALLAGDILRKLLHRVRPYERVPGTTDAVYEKCVQEATAELARSDVSGRRKLLEFAQCVAGFRERFRAVDADYTKPRLLIGIGGEIFCRLNTFSNDDLARRIEAHGGETWIADISEWVFYSGMWEREDLKYLGKSFSRRMFTSLLTDYVQHRDEKLLLQPFEEDFAGLEEPHSVAEIVELGSRYLPPHAALGEMILNLGKAVHLHRKGADAMVDISPFSCMNGIVSEAIYPNLSRDLDGMPVRLFYFDGTNRNLDEDVSIFMEMAAHYSKRKKQPRTMPKWFGSPA
jgi:predicted nucleotide-binding protein (sugar kinase/HSP70/actin superfamily)